MKTVAALGLLALTANAAVVKRQGHSHEGGGGSTYGSPAPKSEGFKIPGLESFNLPGLEGLKLPGLNGFKMKGAMPKGGMMSMMSMPSRKAYKIEQIPPQKYKDARRVRIMYGPYTIRSSKVSPRHFGHRLVD
jgi:hypothetical protein